MTNGRARWLVAAAELVDELGSEKLRVFDVTVFLKPSAGAMEVVSGLDRYLAGHLPGAGYLDHERDLSLAVSPWRFTHKPVQELAATFARAGVAADSKVVFYSTDHVMWATRAWWLLRYCGHDAVRVLDGGLGAWQAAGLPLESGLAQYAPAASLPASECAAMFVDEAQVRAAIGAGDTCTVNALPTALYEGTGPLSYGRPGHIKGSLSLPYGELTPEGRFADTAALQASLSERSLLNADRVISYCGGGIAATALAFALALCGQDQVAVYDGSLQEWSANPANPLVTGSEPDG